MAHTPWQQVYTTSHTSTKRQRKSQHQHTYGRSSFQAGCVCFVLRQFVFLDLRVSRLSVCLCALIYSTKSNKHNLSRWPEPACFHCLSPICQPTYQAEETTAAATLGATPHLQSPLNHFPIHCLQSHITQHPHRLLISELTLREWTWPGRTGACKQHHLTRQSLC